jgi:hypothetical protein
MIGAVDVMAAQSRPLWDDAGREWRQQYQV